LISNIVKNAAAGAVLGGSLLFTAGLGIASAQPLQLRDGLVNLAVGDVTILEDVNVGVAATVAAAVCDVADIGSVNVLAESVDSGTSPSETACTVSGGEITLTQNARTPGQAGQAPGGGPAQAPGNPTPGGPNQ
jgi:hypothetical protein